MTNFNEYETETQRFTRERNENIVNEYIRRSQDILCGKVTPHRLCEFIAERYNMSRYGVTLILKRAGIYKNAKQPCVLDQRRIKEAALQFVNRVPQK